MKQGYHRSGKGRAKDGIELPTSGSEPDAGKLISLTCNRLELPRAHLVVLEVVLCRTSDPTRKTKSTGSGEVETFEVSTTATTCILLLVGRFLMVQGHADPGQEADRLIETYGPGGATCAGEHP